MVVSMVVAACGCGGSSGNSQATPALRRSTDAGILSLLTTANLDANISGTFGPPDYPSVAKRWALPVPVKTNGDARVVPAMNALEAKLGMTLFDRTSIENLADDGVAFTRGIVVSQGTSYIPPGAVAGSYCANVSGFKTGFPNGGQPPGLLSAPGEIAKSGTTVVNAGPPASTSTKLYINLDNPQCTATVAIVIHEFGHALGLGSHFAGFGFDDGSDNQQDFYDVLATLYSVPAGTAKASITAVRLP